VTTGTEPGVLAARDVWKSYAGPAGPVEVLRGATLEVMAGEVVALVGASGTGKSTLLHVVGGLDAPDRGEICVDGVVLAGGGGVDARARATLRNRAIGFVFQFHHLLPEFSAVENVALPLRLRGLDASAALERARELLGRFSLSARLDHAPDALSGGEQQREAVARALVGEPKLVLADEPTGNLDPDHARALFEELRAHARERRVGVLWATHNLALAALSDRALRISSGVLAPAAL
jgi:lipoprotein-releasing system ATP-binding protein